MPKSRTEEQFPLLLFLVGDQEVTQNNKKYVARGRLGGITSGATAIITEWPNYLSSCWVTAFICGTTIFLLTLVLTSCMTLQYHPRLPRCVPNYRLDNHTIHLAHSSREWTQQQLKILDNITHAFPNYQIHLVLIRNQMLTPSATTKQENNKNKIIKALTPDQATTLDQILLKHPNILVTQTVYSSFFKNTPLFIKWIEMSDQVRIFAIRIMQIWQFGGLSFDLLEFEKPCAKKLNYVEKKLKKLIKYGSDNYEKMSSDLVSVDQNGLHIECKTPCHAFFGKILMKLRKIRDRDTPSDVLSRPMKMFCKAGAIDKLFCHNINVLFK